MAATSDSPKIMIVEDDLDDQFMLKRIFSSFIPHATIHVLDNGHACIEYLTANPNSLPHLITMDLNMPMMNGLEATALIKKDARFKHLPVVILSTSDREIDIKASAACGANDYCIKKINYDDLKVSIKELSEKWLKCN